MRAAPIRQESQAHSNWGGRRQRAGRKKAFYRKEVSHLKRPIFTGLVVHHVTMKIRPGLPWLRTAKILTAVATIFADAAEGDRFAPTHWSVQRNHFHLVIEAASSTELSRGMQSLTIRIAKALNRIWGRTGKVFNGRYYARPVVRPVEARYVIRYVLLNRKGHGARVDAIDPASSGPWFDGWAEAHVVPPGRPPVAAPRSELLREQWRMTFALISICEQPAGRQPILAQQLYVGA